MTAIEWIKDYLDKEAPEDLKPMLMDQLDILAGQAADVIQQWADDVMAGNWRRAQKRLLAGLKTAVVVQSYEKVYEHFCALTRINKQKMDRQKEFFRLLKQAAMMYLLSELGIPGLVAGA